MVMIVNPKEVVSEDLGDTVTTAFIASGSLGRVLI
jgi:hypothetical protein